MAQRSLPQAGTGVGDSGPYTSDQWAELFQAVFTGDQEATQGPLIRVWNELEVTKAGLTITTDTGVGFVYGHALIVDPAIAITVALAAAGQERYDRVVMVQNNTAAAYNTNLALPAAYAAGVPRNSARIAILQGAEAGAAVLPVLLTGPNYYMVELARYLVDDAAVGAIDDRRDYCEFSTLHGSETRTDFFPAIGGKGSTAELEWSQSLFSGLDMPDGDACRADGYFTVPSCFTGDMVIEGIVVPLATGNARMALHVRGGVFCGANSYSLLEAYDDIAVTEELRNCITELSIPNAAVGHLIYCQLFRAGHIATDTIGDSVVAVGFLVTYTAHG